MNRQPSRIAFALVTVILTCGGCSSSSIPTSPSATAPGPPATYTLSGVAVGETQTGVAPVEGVRVETGDLRVYVGGLTRFAMTDKDGFYSISGLSAGSNSIRVIKFGYEIDTKDVSIGGDTQLDIQLVRRPTYTLSGMVSEVTPTGQVPVEDVDVYCDSCGDGGHTSAYTDRNGFYSFPAVYAGITPLIVRKTGYEVIDRTPTYPDGSTRTDATVNGDTRFDIQLVRR